VQNKVLKLQVRIKQENEVKIKLKVENGGHLPKLDGKRALEHLVKHRRKYGLLFLIKLQQNGRTGLDFGF